MGTNLFVDVTIGEGVTWRLHLGKRCGPGRLSTMCGAVFPTSSAWTQFLVHNEQRVQVVDEYGREYQVAEVISTYLSDQVDPHEYQIDALRERGKVVADRPVPLTGMEWRDGWPHWVDERGQLFTSGYFR